jgi:serine/threonine protein phosphatase 1
MVITETDYRRIVAIGDIHGHRAPVGEMLDRIGPGSDDLLIFIGDYVDRGPESKQLLDDLVLLKQTSKNALFLKGNHEDMMLGSLGFPALFADFRNWLYNGGTKTLASYGFTSSDVNRMMQSADESRRAAELLDRIPKSHREFLRGLDLYCESEHFFFCHAGLDPYLSIEEGKKNLQDLLWRRDHLYAERPVWEKTVVFGHTPISDVLMTERMIAIDTGLFAFGTLSAVDVLSGEIFQVRSEIRA